MFQCEICDEFCDDEPLTSDATGLRQFCSDDCLCEAIDRQRMADAETREQFQLYGTDIDSWYR